MIQITPITVLVVDNNSDSLFAISTLLTSERIRVITADSFDVAEQIVKAESIDLLIIDIQIASFAAEEVVSVLRRTAAIPHLPVILLSDFQLPGVINRVHGFGTAYHVKKGIAPKLLPYLVELSLARNSVKRPHVKTAEPKPHLTFPNLTTTVSVYPPTMYGPTISN